MEDLEPIKPLTPREMSIAKMLAVGMTNREIAVALHISLKTVDTHRAHVLVKLRLENNVKLARHALRMGWVNLESDLFIVE